MADLDPNLTVDECIYMRATLTDTGPQAGGARQSFPNWWLSPDIQLVGPLSGPGKADPSPAVNTVTVQFTRKDCQLPGPANNRIRVELYVADPSLTMTPGNSALLNSSLVVNPSVGLNATTINWTLPMPTPATGPQSPGHKCLIARCFPRNLTPDPNNFHRVDDPHYAQHNICIVTCSSPCGQNITTTNQNQEEEELVTIHAWADLKPKRHVFKTALTLLAQVPGFEGISTKAPPPFALRFEDFPDARVRDYSREPSRYGYYGRMKTPNYIAQILMKPQQETTFQFLTDMEAVDYGVAHIFHLVHISSNKQVQGGLTVVTVRVKA